MGIEHWRVAQVRTPFHPPYVLDGGLPAELLTHDAQWLESTDPDTGEKTVTFVGPVFEGTEIELELECSEGAPPLALVARFERLKPSEGVPDRAPGPMVYTGPFCPPARGTFETVVVGAQVRAAGPCKLVPLDPSHARITLTLTAVEPDNDRPTD
jgi:hypothetical protein